MKKIFTAIIFSSFVVTSAANATGLFVGGDAIFANASHKAENSSISSGPKNGDIKDSDGATYGLNAGVRFDLLMFLASAEVFYDDLSLSSTDFAANSGAVNPSNSIEINNRYGAKLNVGMAILPRITPFLTYGLAKVRYSSNVVSSGQDLSKTEMVPLYGLGLLVDLPFGITAKASYDYQKLNLKHAQAGAKIRTDLGVAKLGVIYNF